MKQIYVIRKYVKAESIEEALVKEKRIKPTDCFLTDYSATQHLDNLAK
jgi:hypothetical protein